MTTLTEYRGVTASGSIAAAAFFAMAALAVSPAAASSCHARCDSNYYFCNMGGASIGERGCATARSICYSRCGSSSESAARRYGAIAFSKSTLGHGSSRNVHSRSEAEARAIEDCRANAASAADCQVMVFFYDHCGALAVGGRGAYGSDHGPSRRAAASKALAHCRPYDGDTCRVVREVCSP